MEHDIKWLLVDADDPVGIEFPNNEQDPDNWDMLFENVAAVKRRLRDELSLDLKALDSIQDASFFSELMKLVEIAKTEEGGVEMFVQIGIRFSNFGRLFTIYSARERGLAEFPIGDIRKIVESEEWKYVEAAKLYLPYDGANIELRDGKFTWWDRFFDYV